MAVTGMSATGWTTRELSRTGFPAIDAALVGACPNARLRSSTSLRGARCARFLAAHSRPNGALNFASVTNSRRLRELE